MGAKSFGSNGRMQTYSYLRVIVKHGANMSWNWSEVSLWFMTAVVGAAIVKLFDLAVNRYSEKRTRAASKVTTLLDHIKEFGELAELYRFFGYVSIRIARDDSGDLKRDASGKLAVESKILEPEPRFEDAVKALRGADIDAVIAQKIASIRLASPEVLDVALELDPSGDLTKQFDELYIKTVYTIEIILKNKDSQRPDNSLNEMVEALKDADEARRNLRLKVQQYLK